MTGEPLCREPLLERMPSARPAGFAGEPGVRPAYREEAPYKIHGGCGLMGICDESGARMDGENAIRAMAVQRDRGNGLGGGFAGYGIYPDFADHYCFHMMYHDHQARTEAEEIINQTFWIDQAEPIPTRHVSTIVDPPLLWRYFVMPHERKLEAIGLPADDFVVRTVLEINAGVDGAFVFSSGKNMGAFKGVGYPEEIADFFRLDEYSGYTWIGHNRFPTNTPGWWGGAHPFTLLDWAVVHNGEISSYGINRRYLEQFGYHCTLRTDTEVVAYLFDLLLRKHRLPMELACLVLASPLWSEIDRMDADERELTPGAARGLRPGHAERAVRHRPRLRRRHGGHQRPHQAAPAGGRAPGLRSSWSPPRRACCTRCSTRPSASGRRAPASRSSRAWPAAPARSSSPTTAPWRGCLMSTQLVQPEFRVRIDNDVCHKCGRCVQQCGWDVYTFNERPMPGPRQLRACHRCVTYCPAGAITIERSPLAYRENPSWTPALRRAAWRQAETGGVLLTGMGNDRPYLNIFDHLLLNACQVTNPSIDPLREPMELRTYLGRKPDSLEVECGEDGGQAQDAPRLRRRHPPGRARSCSRRCPTAPCRSTCTSAWPWPRERLGILMNTGEGGLHPDLYQYADNTIVQVASGRFGVDTEYLNARRRGGDQDRPGRQAGHRRAPARREGRPRHLRARA